jgi:hypothetical protein
MGPGTSSGWQQFCAEGTIRVRNAAELRLCAEQCCSIKRRGDVMRELYEPLVAQVKNYWLSKFKFGS